MTSEPETHLGSAVSIGGGVTHSDQHQILLVSYIIVDVSLSSVEGTGSNLKQLVLGRRSLQRTAMSVVPVEWPPLQTAVQSVPGSMPAWYQSVRVPSCSAPPQPHSSPWRFHKS